jgi:hypothetical protein
MGQAVKEYVVGEGMLAETDALKVDPNAVKQLGQGECVVIAQGRAQHVAVSQVRLPEHTPVVPATTRSPAIAEIDPTTRQAQSERFVYYRHAPRQISEAARTTLLHNHLSR